MPYKNSPIIEVVFSIETNYPSTTILSDLVSYRDYVNKNFPNKSKRNDKLVFKKHGETSEENRKILDITHDLEEHEYVSEDRKMKLTLDLFGISLNVLKPYISWEEHFNFFMVQWKTYFEVFHPLKVEKLAVRHINRIEIPFGFVSFYEYVRYLPKIPKVLPQHFSSFLTKLQVQIGISTQASITTTILPTNPNNSPVLPFILDIHISDARIDIKEVENHFNKFRKLKNLIFEDFITDKARELFQ